MVLAGLLIYDLTRRGVYDVRMGMNIVVVGESGGVKLLLLRPEEDIVAWVSVPAKVKIKIFNSSASYPIGSLWSYGEAERQAFNVMEKSVGQTMGVVLAKTVKLNKGEQIEDVLGQLLSLTLKTNLSIKDRVLIRNLLSESLKSKKILEYSLPTTVFEEIVEPDGKEFAVFNTTISLWTKNKFIIEEILDENVDVSINNVSSTSGLGTILAKQLESVGARVVEVKADKEDVAEGGKECVYASIENYEMTEKMLTSQLGCAKVSWGSKEDEKGIKVWVKD